MTTAKYQYNKLVNIRRLHKELYNSGFGSLGISYNPNGLPDSNGITNPKITLIVSTNDGDPTDIVNAHMNVEDKSIDFRNEYNRAITTDDKLLILSKFVELIELTDQELEDGRILPI